jgi:hypothetical protein
MPDLITHAAVAYFIARPKRFVRFRIAFYLGAILPDLLARPFPIIKPEVTLYLVGVHTPAFVFLFCLLFAELFDKDVRKSVRNCLIVGSSLHFLLDVLQKHLIKGYLWLFPFSWESFELGLLWPEDSLILIPIWILLISVSEIVIIRQRRTEKNHPFGDM